MSRPTLDADSPTAIKKFKLPLVLSEAFADRCATIGHTQSEQLRTLIERWLRQTAAIARLKGKAK